MCKCICTLYREKVSVEEVKRSEKPFGALLLLLLLEGEMVRLKWGGKDGSSYRHLDWKRHTPLRISKTTFEDILP